MMGGGEIQYHLLIKLFKINKLKIKCTPTKGSGADYKGLFCGEESQRVCDSSSSYRVNEDSAQ